jgi:hypothetical protein
VLCGGLFPFLYHFLPLCLPFPVDLRHFSKTSPKIRHCDTAAGTLCTAEILSQLLRGVIFLLVPTTVASQPSKCIPAVMSLPYEITSCNSTTVILNNHLRLHRSHTNKLPVTSSQPCYCNYIHGNNQSDTMPCAEELMQAAKQFISRKELSSTTFLEIAESNSWTTQDS